MRASVLVPRILELVDANYVVVERAGDVRARIEGKRAAGAYDSLEGAALAESVTADLRECSDDLHFKVIYKEEPQPIRKVTTEESPEEVAEYRRIARFHNYGCSEMKRLAGNVGYWKIDEFYDLIDGSGPTFVASMRLLCDTDALIVDVRDNSGGDPATVALACSFFFDVEPVHLSTFEGRKSSQQWWTLPHLDCDRYLDKAVYILVNQGTVSAAEGFSYDLQALGRASLIGTATRGAAHAREQFQIDRHFFINIPTLRTVNPKTKSNWEGTGVVPDVESESDAAFTVAYRAALRALEESHDSTDAERAEISRALQALPGGN